MRKVLVTKSIKRYLRRVVVLPGTYIMTNLAIVLDIQKREDKKLAV